MENEIKLKLKERGFSDKTLLNNRGLIDAVIEESQAKQLNLSGVSQQRELLIAYSKAVIRLSAWDVSKKNYNTRNR